jgi:Uma2 family endonuclease
MAAKPEDSQRHYYSLDEYFALEGASHARYEYWDGDIVCMSGGSKEHGAIAGNVFYRLRQKLEGGSCRALTADTAVKTPSLPPYRYPDVSVGCGDLIFESIRGVDALVNPILIVEVLSPATARHDQEDKFVAYKAIPGFKEYLLVAQDSPHVKRYFREGDSFWSSEELSSLETVRLVSVGCEWPLAWVYESVTFRTV